MSNKIELVAGNSRTYLLTVRDKTGTIVVLTGATIELTAKRILSSLTPDIDLSNADQTQIEDFNLIGGQAKIHFKPADTEDLVGRLVYDVVVTLLGKPYTVILDIMKIKKGVTD